MIKNPNLRGRLVFYPTFFDEVNLDVITPHDRKTKTPSRGPIYFETVPLKKRGKIVFLIYYIFPLI
jgi:CRISPR-associated protein Cmr2